MLQQLAEIILLAVMRYPLSLRNVEDENLPNAPVDASAIPRKKRRLTRIIGQRILMEERLRERELERSEKCLSEAAPGRDRLRSAIRFRVSKPDIPLPAKTSRLWLANDGARCRKIRLHQACIKSI
jgi:hypothetical protein